ncbi:pilus assembly protein PilZ [Methylobacterium sp. Leaf123]|uniref:PilZ domain-containing protein n=1 Tax=Methylobacterium sp. Leaf123 TaxID=1736264 RepID=UPI0006F87100|nr:PilZ domain-containing protein [Methylobacterium sp. Leaf123]KQQ30871.1 pilus assembly protein PilZ [Methylobacterium sp. Leaf123]
MADPRENVSPEAAPPVERVGKRHRVVQQGRIVLGPEHLIACTVRDLSRQGAKIRVAPEHDLPEMFSLVIAAHDLRTMTVRLCWRRGDFAGVAFEGEPVV